jgi:hypothetical protein
MQPLVRLPHRLKKERKRKPDVQASGFWCRVPIIVGAAV